ncbi:MAG: hypothetical protein ACR2J8_11645 [Thermomicrobiales bacterium]
MIVSRSRLLAAAGALALTLLPAAAMAHVNVDVADGEYVLEIGFQNEPAYLGQANAIYVKAGKYGTGGTKPADGLAGSLVAEVDKDGKTLEIPLIPQDGGVYVAPFFPTALGDYTFRITGEIDGKPVAAEVSSSPTTFNPVEPLASVQFPAALPDTAEVAAQAQAAAAAASSARTIGFAGVALGALGLLAGLAGLLRRK